MPPLDAMTAMSERVPPRSATTIVLSTILASARASYARTAATGSEMNWRTSMPASLAAWLRASFCLSAKFVGTVMTAALTLCPRKSDAEEANRRICRVVISEAVIVSGISEEVSRIEKATVSPCF